MSKKEKSPIMKMIPFVISLMLLAAGVFWLIAGLLIQLMINSSGNGFIEPYFWIVGSSLAVIGLVILIVFSVITKKENEEITGRN